MSDKLIAIDNIRLTKDGRLVDKSSGYYELYSIGYDTETQSIYYTIVRKADGTMTSLVNHTWVYSVEILLVEYMHSGLN